MPTSSPAVARDAGAPPTTTNVLHHRAASGPTHDDITASPRRQAFGVRAGVLDRAGRVAVPGRGTTKPASSTRRGFAWAHVPAGRQSLIDNPVSARPPGVQIGNVFRQWRGVPSIMPGDGFAV